jgi:hypothetical protein
MATLSPTAIDQIWSDYNQIISRMYESVGDLNKNQLRSVIEELDQWYADQIAAASPSFPIAADGQLTANQVTQIMSLVVQKRFDEGM